jgi:hypothetical protein
MRYVDKIAQVITSFADRVNIHNGKPYLNDEYKGLANEKGNYFYTYASGDVERGVSYTSCVNMVQEITLVVQSNCFDSEIQLNAWLNAQLNGSSDVQSVISSYTDKYRIQREETGNQYESDLLFAKIKFQWTYSDCYECTEFIAPPNGDCEPIFLNVTDCEGNTTTTEIPQGSTININDFVCVGGGETYTYRVEYENGTLIQEGTVTENLIVQVPNPIQCDDATYNLDNTEGATLFLGSIPSGDNETIIAPDGTATVKNTAGTTVATGLVPSGSGADITAPDATFSINSTQVATIPSGTSDSIEVRKQSGSNQIGALQGQHWRIDNSAITLKDTANNTLSTTSVPATESADIIAPNGNIENTNETFIESVLSGGTLVLNDQNVEVNGQLEGAFVAMQTLEIETLDEDMNITSPIVSFAPEILTIQVETLDTFTWAFLVVNWDNPPTFVATIAGYDIYLYTLNSVDRYRSVPEPYVNSLDAFWEDFDGTNLINLITNRL